VALGLAIRRLEEVDLPAYKALRDEMLAADPEAFTSDAEAEARRAPSSYRSRLGLDRAEGGQFVIGAWIGERLVGAIGCERDERIKVRHIGHLIGMMVRRDARGAGIGRALLDACIAEARRTDGLELLTLTVTAGNVAATKLYRQAGFVLHGTLPRAIRVGERYLDKDQMHLVLHTTTTR
jgi:ribosomal protein S18 acetylase RimI-like enzyme